MKKKTIKIISVVMIMIISMSAMSLCAFADGNVAGAIEGTWKAASGQIKTVVNNVVFPIIDLILAVFFFAKLGLAYFDYRKSGHFEWAAPAILFACLVFTLTAPTYVWTIINI
ncbi:MAG: DUF3852 domain-containing protein [Lachnospiraceae bacterium]|nr:DUF3852 domain-containing protein [Ruminococcus sp.]MCM1276850.1 DUF3852 domain-containing protein [Lachnospiraceae bacterium]